jgi:type I restriction enzyme R subunit
MMTTGVDAQTCKLIVLDGNIGSMTEFKQIIGRGTRIKELVK